MTQLLVLGLLNKQPMSGYDIQVALQTSGAEGWGGVLVGSIYHALNKLEKQSYIRIASVEQTGRRQKAVYEIADAGKQYLEELILQSLRESSVTYPTTLYSGLCFLDDVPGEQSVQALETHKELLEKQYLELQNGYEEKKQYFQGELPAVSELVFENMFAALRQQRDFVEKLIGLLRG